MKANKLVINNLGLKILSLILAIGTWFYINMELTNVKIEEEKAIFSMLHYDVVSKKLPIQLTIVGKVRSGYKVDTEGITIDPEICAVIGPKNMLENVEIARTIPVDISEYTQNITKDLALAPIAKGMELKNYFVKVFIPILKEAGKDINNK
ncbi:MAG: YbbR-like domain-containing protein [Candidatus Omnitrophica bacterium]|nr:YbbR-like domain-containing protein [Candidatus Omnitrophota bacterium]